MEISQRFKKAHELYKSSDAFIHRDKQTIVANWNRDLIFTILGKVNFNRKDLIALLYILKNNTIDRTKANYLNQLFPNGNEAIQWINSNLKMGQKGYTTFSGIGNIDNDESKYEALKQYLLKAFQLKDDKQALEHMQLYFKEYKLEYVGLGKISPILHYINPQIFPIVNGEVEKVFKENFKIKGTLDNNPMAYYKLCYEVRDFIKESDFAHVDAMIYTFEDIDRFDLDR